MRELFSQDLQSGVVGWDRHYHVDARTPGAEALIRAIVPALPAALGAIVRWDDRELICERAVAAITSAELGEVADGVRALAARLAAHRRSICRPTAHIASCGSRRRIGIPEQRRPRGSRHVWR